MKRLSLVDGFKTSAVVALAFVLAVAAFLLCGCASAAQAASTGNDQIVKAAIELAEEYRSLGHLEEAFNVYDRALERTYDYRLLYNKALAAAYLGDLEKAIELCQEGHESFPHILAFKKAQAKYYIELGSWHEAATSYLEVLELDPYDTSTRKELISLYSTNGESEKVVEQATILWSQGYRTAEILGFMKTSYPSVASSSDSLADFSKED